MGQFDNIKQALRGDAATVDPDYAQTPQDPRSTSLTNRLLESKARIRDEKVARAQEVFGHKNTAPIAEQKAYIKSPDNTVNLPSSTISDEDMLKPFHELGEQPKPDPIAAELFDNQLKEDLAPEGLQIDLDNAATKYKLPKKLLKALAKQESNFDNTAVSQTGVRGVLQVTEETGKEMFEGTGIEFDVTNQDHQIEAGAKYLAKHIKGWKKKGFGEQQSQQLATMSYNTGFSRVSEAISATKKKHPGMQEIEDAGIELFKQRWDTRDASSDKEKPSGKRRTTKKQTALNSFIEGAGHWKKIHYQDGELQDYTTTDVPTVGVKPPAKPFELGLDDFETEVLTAGTKPPKREPAYTQAKEDLNKLQQEAKDEEENKVRQESEAKVLAQRAEYQKAADERSKPSISPSDIATPGGIAKAIQQGDTEALKDKVQEKAPVVPMDVPKEWGGLLGAVIANEDAFLMGLDGGIESLKIASKEFMKSKKVTGLTSEQAIKYLNDNVTELIDWIKDTRADISIPIETSDQAQKSDIGISPKEVESINVPEGTAAKIIDSDRKDVDVPDVEKKDLEKIPEEIEPTKIEKDRELKETAKVEPKEKPDDRRVFEEEAIIDDPITEDMSTADIYKSRVESYNPVADLDAMSDRIKGLSDEEIERQLRTAPGMAPLESASKVVEQLGNNVFKHEDETWTVIAQDGSQLLLKDEIIARSFAAYDEANASADPDAPTTFAGQTFNQIMGSFAFPAELIASSFTQNRETLDNIKEMSKKYTEYFGINRKHMAGASVALSLIAEQKGSVEAVKYAFDNIGTFLKKGFDSVGFTLALAVGNVPVQIGMLASLSIGKANKMKEEWKALPENKGKELTPEIAARIEISSAFSMLAEKVSVQALKGVVAGTPLIKVDPTKWMNKVGDAINRGINKNLGTKTAALLLVKPITKIAAPLGGEGLQEVASQVFEHYGLKGEFLSKSEMVAVGIEGTLAAPGVAGTIAGLQVTKAVADKLRSPNKAVRHRTALQAILGKTNEQLGKITIEDRINDLDQQIADLSVGIDDTDSGVITDNKRFGEIFDDLRSKDFKHSDAIVEAKARLAEELKNLKNEKTKLETDTKPLKFKDNEFLSSPVKKDLALVKQQIEELKKTEPKEGEATGPYYAKLETLENKQKTLETKLESRVNKQQLDYLRKELTEAKIKLETALKTDLKDEQKTGSIFQKGVDAGKKLKKDELPRLLKKITVIAEGKDPGMLIPENELDPIGLDATSDYTADENSGLEVIKETEGGAVTSNTVQLKEEPAEWTDEKTGRRLTKEDFDSPIEYQQFVKKTRKFDADRERGIAELKKIRSEQIKGLTPEDIYPVKQQLLVEELEALAERDLTDEERKIVREKVQELKTKGILPPDSGKKKSKADKLFSGPTAFADAQNATPEELKAAINDPKTDADTKKHLMAVAKAQRDQEILDKKLESKDFADVHEEIVSGESKQFKGLHTYRNEIIELIKNPQKLAKELVDQQVSVLYEAMGTHATNLSNKLNAFQTAYKSAESGFLDPGKLWAVSGVIDPEAKKTNPNTRKMQYTVSEMTRTDFDKEVEERRGAGGTSFLTEISSDKQTDTTLNSQSLINILKDEVKLGSSAWEAVRTYPKSSLAKNEARAAGKKIGDSEFLAELDKIEEKIGVPVTPISDETINSLKDPQKKTKAQPKGKPIEDEITEVEAKIKAVQEKIAARDAKKDILRSSPDENNELEKELSRLQDELGQLKNLQKQADQQPSEDTESEGADSLSDETTEISEPPVDSDKQSDDTAGETGEEAKTKAGKVQDFITSAVKKYWPVIVNAGVSSKDRMMGMLGTFFNDLVQIGEIENIPGLHTLKDTDFVWTDADIEAGVIRKPQKLVGKFSVIKLSNALKALGVDKATAKHIALQYGKFKDRYDNIALGLKGQSINKYGKNIAGSKVRILNSDDTNEYEIISITNGIAKLKDTAKPVSVEQLFDARNYALREPLSILLRPDTNSKGESVGKLPDQILLGMYLGILSFTVRKPNNIRFTSDWQKKQFLYSGKEDPSTTEILELVGLGHGFNETADSVGKDVAKSLKMSAKQIAEDHPTLTQDSADLYYSRLLPALGMMAIDIAAGKDSEALFSVENKTWNFDEANKPKRNFNNPKNENDDQTYRHIKYPEKKKSKKELSAVAEDKSALEKITEQLDMSLESYGEVLREPVEVSTRINRSLKKVPRKVIKALKKLHNAKWNVSETLGSVTILNEDHRDVLNQLIGILPTEGDMHQRQRDSNEAANRDKNNDLDAVLEADKEGKLKDFYFGYELQGHHRVLQQGKINPQHSKVTRFLLQSWGAQTYNKDNLWKFKLAVAQNFGLDIDKNNMAYAETEFDHIINNGNVQEAVKAMQVLKEDKNNKEAANKLAEALSEIKSTKEYKDVNIQLVTAITALTNYMPSGNPLSLKTEFKSDIVMEIDGITNGFAMNLLQFPMFEDGQLEKHLNQVGNWFDVRSLHDPSKPDVYMNLIDYIEVGATNDAALSWYINNSWKNDFIAEAGKYTKGTKKKPVNPKQKIENDATVKAYKALYASRNTALEALAPDMYLYDKGMRKTVKYPFMIYMYGGGTKSIAQGVASDIVDSLYEQATDLHNEYQEMLDNVEDILRYEGPGRESEAARIEGQINFRIEIFLDSLEKLGAFEGKKDLKGNINPTGAKERYKTALLAGKALDTKNGKAIYNFNDTELTKVIGRTVEPRFEHGLDSMLGNTKDARSSVIKMGQMMHRMFMLRYETAYKNKLAKINDEYEASLSEEDKQNFIPLDRLTDQQVKEMISGANAELSEVIPQAAGPLSQMYKDKEGKEHTDGALDLSSIETVRTDDGNKNTDLSKKRREALELRSDKIENKMTPSEKDNRPLNRAIMAKQLLFVEPGVSALIRQIQNMDSVILTQTFGGGNGKGDPEVNVGFTSNAWQGDGNVLPLHDAFMASPEQLSMLSEIYGKTYIEYNKKYSIIETTLKQVKKIKDTLTEEQVNELNNWYYKEEQQQEKQNPKDADDFIKEFEKETDQVIKAREKLFAEMKARGMVSHQLYMPQPGTSPSTQSRNDAALNEVNSAINKKGPLPGAEIYRPVLPFNDANGDPVKVNDDQWRAMAQMEAWWGTDISDADNKIFVLQGRGGTGKTTIVEAALTNLGLNIKTDKNGTPILDEETGKKISDPELGQVKFALPTHKAKQVIQQAAGKYRDDDFDTIAGLLGEKPEYVSSIDDTGQVVWKAKFEKNPEAAQKQKDALEGVKVIVIDEASMVNEKQTKQLIAIAEELEIRLLFMGDNVQLPPIEKFGKGTVDVAMVFDTVMEINQKDKVPINIEAHYAKLDERMRQDAGNPILGVTDILANVAEWFHKHHTIYKKEFGKNSDVNFQLPFINNDNVTYKETHQVKLPGIKYKQHFPTDSTITEFAEEYKKAKEAKNEKGVKYIHFNAGDHVRSMELRAKIRKAIFGEADPGLNEKGEFIKPFLKGERLVIDESTSLLNGQMVESFTKKLKNGDEVTVHKELETITYASYKDGVDNEYTGENAPVYENITVNVLEVKLDGNDTPFKLVLKHDKSEADIQREMMRKRRYGELISVDELTKKFSKSQPGRTIFTNLSASEIASDPSLLTGYKEYKEGKIAKEMFTQGLGAAYIINSHKAQGSTYDTVYADYENILRGFHGSDFLTRVKALYVATSRPRTRLVLVGSSGQGKKLSFGTGVKNTDKKSERYNEDLFDANQKIKDDIENGVTPLLDDAIEELTDQIKSGAPIDAPTPSWKDLDSFLDDGLTKDQQRDIEMLVQFEGTETVMEYINNPQSLKLELKLIESQAKEDEARAEADEEFGMNEDGGEFDEGAAIDKGKIVLHDILVNKGATDTLGSIGSINDLPKVPTAKPKDLGSITEGSFKKLFNKFKEFSTQYYADAQEMLGHTETLETVLDILGEGITEIGGIKLTLQEVNGITQGEYDIANKAMTINLSNGAPFTVNQSPQEVYVHELLHSTTALAIRENPLIANRVDRVYLQTKRALDSKYGKGLGYKVFLDGIAKPSANDIAMAKKQYNYVFAGREKNRLHEFLAYSTTNRQMINFLKTQPKAVREGILDNILGIIASIMNFLKSSFGSRTYAAKSENAFAEILAATEHLVATQAKHQSMLDRLGAYTYNNLDKSDEFLKQTGENLVLKIKGKDGENQGILRAAASTVSGGIYGLLHTDNEKDSNFNRASLAFREKIDQKLNKTMRGIASEIGDGALTKEMIEQLLYVKVNISKARQQAETFTMSWFNGYKEDNIKSIWRSVKEGDKHGLDAKTKVALTRVLFQTDLSVLLNEGNEWEMTPAEIMDLIGHNGKARRDTLKARIAKDLKLSHRSDALSYAKELGYWIATGNTRLDDSHTNVSTIAAKYFTNPTTAEINLLDMYSTLSALEYTDANHNEAVLKLAKAEFGVDFDRNGISDLLKSHRTYKQNIRADNFEENELQLVKGYIVERIDNFTRIQMGRADQKKEMKERGYSESYPVRKIDSNQTIDTMYVTRTTPEVTDVSGVMSTTNQRNMGTTLTEILVRDPAYQHTKGPNKGKPDFYKIKTKVEKFIKAKSRAAKANNNNVWDDTLSMRPLRDQNGNVTDYRVMMNHADVEQIIRPDLEIDRVFAHMRSSAVDRKETIESDKKTVELLVYEQMDMMQANPGLHWINIMDPNSPYIDRYRKLPKAVREHMKEYAVGGQFFIREDIIDKVFGYKSFDLSELKMLQDDNTKSKRIIKRVAGVTHHAIKQTVGYGKNRVVIAMPKVVIGNMMSNIYQLMMRKIPLDYIFHKIYEGVHEYNKYRKDTERRVKVKHEMDSQNLDKINSPEAIEIRELDDRIKGNLIHKMSKAGLNSLIVEDINDAQTDGWLNKLKKTIPYSFPTAQKYLDKVPSELGNLAAFVFMTKGSKPYQISRHIVQMTDFLARYVMIEHGTKVKGRPFNDVMHESLDGFVVFDEALVPALESLEAIGATSFLSYYLRNARASRKLAASSPTGVALAAAVQHTTGISALGNVNSSWLAGRFSPNMLQTDDLFDEANNVTLFDVVKNEGRDLFN